MVRGLLAWEWTDLEGRLLEVEGLCVVREYLVLRSVLRALIRLRERLPPDRALGWLEGLLREVLLGAESDLDRYGVYASSGATYLALELESILDHIKQGQEARGEEEAAKASGDGAKG